MNLLYLRFWSVNLVEFTVRSPMADSDRWSDEWGGRNFREKVEERKKGNKNELTLWKILIEDERGGQNLRENGEERKMKLLERWWFF